jgi:hypothetical protein
VAIAAALLVVCDGGALNHAAEDSRPGVEHDVLSVVGRPAGWIADRLPFAAAATQITGWLSPDEKLGNSGGGFSAATTGSGPSRVSPQAFTPAQLGVRPTPRPLRSLLITGDSMSQPLDAELARRVAARGVRPIRDAHLGTGISKSFLVDWGRLSARQAQRIHPDAVVVFLGANEGFPMKTAAGTTAHCCGAAWAAEYATRARAVMDAYRRGGRAEVYWLLLPAPRDPARARIARTVNAAIRVAAGAFGAQVSVVDVAAVFTPGGRFRSAMPVGGRDRIVRSPDGIHLTEVGAGLLADQMVGRLRGVFALGRR